MKKYVTVLVTWTDKKLKNLPNNLKYITVAKFAEDTSWEKEAWSIALDFDISPKIQRNPSKAKASFLADDSPQERLIVGKSFKLFEGREKVADVEIICTSSNLS